VFDVTPGWLMDLDSMRASVLEDYMLARRFFVIDEKLGAQRPWGLAAPAGPHDWLERKHWKPVPGMLTLLACPRLPQCWRPAWK